MRTGCQARVATRNTWTQRLRRIPAGGLFGLLAWGYAMAASGQEVTPVEAVGDIADQTLIISQDPELLYFGEAFVGTIQRCDIVSSRPGVVTVEKQDGFNVLLAPQGLSGDDPAVVRVTVGNTNPEGVETSAFVEFDVHVVDAAPTAVGAIDDVTLRIGQTRTVDVATNFEGENLEFAVDGGDAAATVTVEGSVLTLTGLDVGTAEVTVTASNSNEATAMQTFNVIVRDTVPRSLATWDDLTLEIGESWSTDIVDAFSGTNLAFAAETPDSAASVALDGTMLTVTGLAVGEAVVTVTASNSEGEVSAAFTVTVVDVAPTNTAPLADLELRVGETWSGDLAASFDGTNLVFDAETPDSAVSVAVDGSEIIVEGLVAGTATVTVGAENSAGRVSDSFMVRVRDVPAEVEGPLDDLTMIIGETRTLTLDDKFSGTGLTFAAVVDDAATVAVSVSDTALTLDALALGGTSVEVTASNSEGEVTAGFSVRVVDAPPAATNSLTDIVLNVGASRSFDLSSYFSGTSLVYSASDGNAAVATALSDANLVVEGTEVGRARINVAARNSAGVARQSFLVTVALAPATFGSLPDVTLVVGDDPYEVDVAGNFIGDPLAYSLESSDRSIAAVVLSGTRVTVAPTVEGTTTVTVSASNILGQVQLSFDVHVVADPDEVAALEMGLAAIARNILSSATAAINGRFSSAPKSAGTPEAALSAARQGSWAAGSGSSATLWDRWEQGTASSGGLYQNGGMWSAPWQGPSMGAASRQGPQAFSFALDAVPGDADKSWSYWGQGDVQRFEGSSYDGVLTSVYVGADADFGDLWNGGVAVSRSMAEVDYWFGAATDRRTGVLETELVSVFPYASWELGQGHLWGVLGAGWGEATSDRADLGRRQDADLSMWMWAVGGRHELTSGSDGIALSLVEDVGMLSLITDGCNNCRTAIEGVDARVGRARVGLEVSRAVQPQEGVSLVPFAAAMARHDFGDGEETGTGLDMAAGLRYKNQPLRLGVEAKAHWLATHSSDAYEESGMNLTVSVLPLRDGSGWRLAISPRWGHDDRVQGLMSPAPLMWSGPAHAGFGDLALRQSWALDVSAGYGILAPRLRGVVVPFAELEGARRGHEPGGGARVGVRYDFAGAGERLVNVEFSGGQRERMQRRVGHVELRAEARF